MATTSTEPRLADDDARRPVTVGRVVRLIDAAVDAILTPMRTNLIPRVRGLEGRIARLEQAPRLKYCGVFELGKSYERGDVVTWDGSMWHAERDTGAKPGTASSADDWRLCVKRGRDGRDGRTHHGA